MTYAASALLGVIMGALITGFFCMRRERLLFGLLEQQLAKDGTGVADSEEKTVSDETETPPKETHRSIRFTHQRQAELRQLRSMKKEFNSGPIRLEAMRLRN